MFPTETLKQEAPSFVTIACALLRDGYSIRFRVSGFSMKPSFCDGDILVFKPVSPRLPRTGDVALYLAEGNRLVAHRVVRIASSLKDPLFHIRGDSPGSPVDIVPAERILGVATLLERHGRSTIISRARHGLPALLFSSLRRFATSILRHRKARPQPQTSSG